MNIFIVIIYIYMQYIYIYISHIYIYIYIYIYISVEKILSFFMLILQKNDSFLSFHSPIFHSKIHKHSGTFSERGWGKSLKWTYVEEGGGLHVKWTGMNKGGADQKFLIKIKKFWVNVLFEWTQSLFAATMIYDMLIFNLTHSFISL